MSLQIRDLSATDAKQASGFIHDMQQKDKKGVKTAML